MKPNQTNSGSIGASTPDRHRWVLYVIVLGTALPVIAAYLFHYYAGVWFADAQTVNRGVLITPPLAIQQMKLLDKSGQPFFSGEFPGKWYILQLAGEECADRCLERRHELRQVHVALGKEMSRVNRLLLREQGSSEMVDLQQTKTEEPPLLIAYGNLDAIRSHFGQIDGLKGMELHQLFFLVDPLGNVMMYYTPANSGKDLLKDLKKLLKASQIG